VYIRHACVPAARSVCNVSCTSQATLQSHAAGIKVGRMGAMRQASRWGAWVTCGRHQGGAHG